MNLNVSYVSLTFEYTVRETSHVCAIDLYPSVILYYMHSVRNAKSCPFSK
jgi:hypothetical protein